ncbi:MAG TPA: Rne/Rng family ribonuclease [Rhizomicrobium sp.]|nr:Rne/Rng family ribonuclease [Rhizomicrobium sp.]
MPKRMLIDASHPEETRVVVLDGQKVEEFDFEAASKRPLKGNIYLAKVTRVEPSLQAAFVEYGGNRQGFLAFSEIHPDYYQIPVADRLALLAEQEAEARRRADEDIESFDIAPGPKPESAVESDDTEAEPASEFSDETPTEQAAEMTAADERVIEAHADNDTREDEIYDNHASHEEENAAHRDDGEHYEEPHGEHEHSAETSELPSGGDETADAGHSHDENGAQPAAEVNEQSGQPRAQQAQRPPQRWMRKRHYKIQEVIKRRQIILVQVVKEERGNKGAALTTYLSLAGRYCVLMPNTPRGGGISRKITNLADRKRLKSAAQALELPEGMGLIIRTAGENRTKVEIKRDYEYLLRMWATIVDTTVNAIAPACVYEEGDIIKRAIRDLYNKDVAEIVVEGPAGYRNAKDFMRMLMPTHAKNVKPYQEAVPLYQRFHIEAQLDAMFSPTVTLKSGGYIVINQTEALVSIDVNSGRATREHSIEETARKTNLEAAEEVGRQLRLRDLAGLIVIDFIDMEDGRNDRDVEKRIRDAVKNDRARIQIGKISQFGLLEMSRQRLRAGVIAGSTVPCPHCGGQGLVRSVESTSLRVLRGLEEEAQKQRAEGLTVRVASDVAIYTLNQKRRELSRLESEYSIMINFEPKPELMAGAFEIDRVGQRNPEDFPRPAQAAILEPVSEDEDVAYVEEEELDEEDTAIAEAEDEAPAAESEEKPARAERGDGERNADGSRRRRRRGGRNRGGRDRDRPARGDGEPRPAQPAVADGEQPSALETAEGEVVMPEGGEDFPVEQTPGAEGQFSEQDGEARRKRRRRRGRRGGNRDRVGGDTGVNGTNGEHSDAPVAALYVPDALPPVSQTPASFGTGRFGDPDEIDTTPQDTPTPTPNMPSAPVWSLNEAAEIDTTPKDDSKPSDAPVKKGWWQRAFKS